MDETVKKLDDSVTDLRRVVLNEKTLTNFSATVNNMRAFSEQAINTVNDINAFIATNGSQASLAVSNVVFFSQELMRLANSAEGVLATNSTEITAAVKNVESSTEVLKSLLSDVQSGKGLAGTMLQNEQLATNVPSRREQPRHCIEQFKPARTVGLLCTTNRCLQTHRQLRAITEP